MSVDYRIEDDLLAGSEPINAPLAGSSDHQTPNTAPRDAEHQDEPPKRTRGPNKRREPGVLLFRCDHCERAIRGSGAGFVAVSLVDAAKTARRASEGRVDPAKARWHVAHRACLPQAIAPLGGWFLIWTTEIGTTDDVLDVMARLSRSPWFAWSDWGTLVRDILADTESAAIGAGTDPDRNAARRAQRAAARLKGLPPGDARHGTVNAFDHWGLPLLGVHRSEIRQPTRPARHTSAGETMLTTEIVLVTIAGHMTATGLAQYDENGHYLNHPDLPALIFADADTPDVALVLTCTGQDADLGHWDVEFSWRATGVTPRCVDVLADNTFEHFQNVLGVKATNVVWQYGSVVELPSLRLPGLLEWTAAERITRGPAELSSPAKHNGTRFVRKDTYRVTMLPE